MAFGMTCMSSSVTSKGLKIEQVSTGKTVKQPSGSMDRLVTGPERRDDGQGEEADSSCKVFVGAVGMKRETP